MTAPAPPSAASRLTPARCAALVAALAVLPFLTALPGGLFADDAILIRKGLTASPLSPEFYYPGFYGHRPNIVPALLFVADGAIHGGHLAGCRVTNLLLHGAGTALLFLLAHGLFAGRVAPAMTAALIFALHPARAETVAWISGRQDLACTLAMLAALLLFARGRFAAASVATLFAFASKETAVVLPLLFIALARASSRRPSIDARRFLRFAFIAAALYLAMRLLVYGVDAAGHSRMGPSALARTALLYPAVFLFPPLVSFPQSVANLAGHHILAVAALLLLALRRARDGEPALRFGLLLYAATFLPVAHLVPIPDYIPHADRFLHVPALGLAIATAALLFPCDAPPRRIRAARAFSAALALALALAAAQRAPLFTDYPVAVDDALELNPRNEAALFLVGRMLIPSDPAGAAARFRAALRDAPYDNPFFHERLVAALHAAGDGDGATTALREGFARFPGHPRLRFQHGRMLRDRGDAAAAAEFAAAARAAPRDVEITRARARMHRGTAAVEILRAARAANPWHFQTENNLAVAHLEAGDAGAALDAAERALALVHADPRDSRAPLPLGVILATRAAALHRTGRSAEARETAATALLRLRQADGRHGIDAEAYARALAAADGGTPPPAIPFEE